MNGYMIISGEHIIGEGVAAGPEGFLECWTQPQERLDVHAKTIG